MDRRINPFSELYVTETIPLSEYVKIFSPYVVEIAEELFLPGNVVLKGVQGCGKSMLLTLLRPELRVAYLGAGAQFPLRGRHASFIAAGINLTRSRALDVGQRRVTNIEDAQMMGRVFGDFLNYWLVGDLIRSIEVYSNELSGAVSRQMQLRTDPLTLNGFAEKLSNAECWLGYLDGCESFDHLRAKIGGRIQAYFRYFQFVSDLPRDIQETRTAIGDPVSFTAECLLSTAVVPTSVHILMQIDQYEELGKIEAQFHQGAIYRSIVHKLLAQRNPFVSYRIGTRSYGFKEEQLEVFGTTARLERDRNYKVIHLDELLRRHENRKSWAFPKFAEDVFKKRMRVAGFDVAEDPPALELVFGRGLGAEEKAVKYCRNKGSAKVVRLEPTWPEIWKDFLRGLSDRDPLSARLAEAWARQKGKESVVNHIPEPPYPWDGKAGKPYWRKERVEAALMQIASRCYQRMIWAGKDDIVALSGGNILVFVGICQNIWSAWLRTAREVNRQDPSLLHIDENTQALGIHEASKHWFQKLSEESEGNRRQRFVSYVGIVLQRKMLSDAPLSNPGANGFSLRLQGNEGDKDVWEFLDDAVDYGALFDAPHTTKEKSRRPRRKWYLNPILSPHFQLPHVRTKEPLYVTLQQVRSWIDQSVEKGAMVPADPTSPDVPVELEQQQSLFSLIAAVEKN